MTTTGRPAPPSTAHRDDLEPTRRLGWLPDPLPPVDTDIRYGRADVGDVELEYWIRGAEQDGPTVLLAHAGVFGEWFTPVFHDPALDGLRVVRVHRAGYGASTAPDRHLTLADHARQCCDLLRALGAERAVWVGHSSSGCIGLQAALDAPDLVERLVLLEPAPNPAGPSGAELHERVVGPVVAAVGAGDIAGAADLFLRGVDGPGYRRVLVERLGPGAPDRLVRDARFFFTDEIRAAVGWRLDPAVAHRIAAPTLLVVGEESRRVTAVFDETAALLAGMLPDARVVRLPGVGHGMPLQDPAAVARLVADAVRAG